MNIDMQQAAHGRAPAVATGIKRVWPKKHVFTYQGDGDLAAIGTAETIHACNRGENIVIFFINNGIYGMTGGQMAPTTLPNMKSSTSPYGRDVESMGNPLKITELIANLPGVHYVTRSAVHLPKHVRKTKKAVRKAFEVAEQKKGVAFVEIVSNCNSGWKMKPTDANTWMEENMFPYYPLGDIKIDGEIVNK
jgi:2-oxoglutarate ferredoxin oxidoreductase subunit beta